jgi:RNA polymerase sigma-70 factor (ECF subfamily)
MAAFILANSLILGFVTGNACYRMSVTPPFKVVAGSQASQTADLLARCGAGDKAAFRKLYDSNSARMYGVALRITRSQALASDAVHDAMLQVWRNSDRYDPSRGNAEGWLVSLVRYRALDIIRKQGREITGVEMPELADEEPDVLSRLVSSAENSALGGCLQEVEAPRRRLVTLAFIEGLTQSEIASRLGQPLGTVKSSIRRALLVLRACMDRTAGAPS